MEKSFNAAQQGNTLALKGNVLSNYRHDSMQNVWSVQKRLQSQKINFHGSEVETELDKKGISKNGNSVCSRKVKKNGMLTASFGKRLATI